MSFRITGRAAAFWEVPVAGLQPGETCRVLNDQYLVTEFIGDTDERRVVNITTGKVSVFPGTKRVQPTDIHIDRIEDQEPF